MFEATTTVTAEASSMLKPLQKNKNKSGVSQVDQCAYDCYIENLVMSEEDVVFWLKRNILKVASVPGGGDWCKVLAHGLDHSATPHPEPGTDAHASVQQQPDGCGFVGIHAARRVHEPQRYQRSDGITEDETKTILQ